jgi:hypothetical protein
MAIEALSDIQKGGVGAFQPSEAQQVFIQPTKPADTGKPYIWIQTGLPDSGWTVYYNDTGTT